MTVVCAIRDGRVILMSSDTVSTADSGFQLRRKDSKMFWLSVQKTNDMLVGYCGSYTHFQLMRCRFSPPMINRTRSDPWEYLVSDFVPSLKEFFKQHFGKLSDDEHPDREKLFSSDSTLLIAFCGRIFSIFDDGQVEESAHDFAAIGANEVSLGAMYALHTLQASGQGHQTGRQSGQSGQQIQQVQQLASWEILDAGMKAASEFNSTVGSVTETKILFA